MSECEIEAIGQPTELGVRIHADAPEQLFACAAQAMFALLRTQPNTRRPACHHTLTIHSTDGEGLFIDWLNELLYLYATSGALFTDCTILRWTATHLDAQVTGYPPLAPPARQIRAATYHQLTLQANSEGWTAEVYFDG